jgi:hypothetical protein
MAAAAAAASSASAPAPRGAPVVRVGAHTQIAQAVEQCLAALASEGSQVSVEGRRREREAARLALSRGPPRAGLGKAVTKTISVAEITKRRVAGLHQLNSIDLAEPPQSKRCVLRRASLARLPARSRARPPRSDPAEPARLVPAMRILLSRRALDATLPGYQPPLDPATLPRHVEDALRRRAAPPRPKRPPRAAAPQQT